MIRRDKMGAKKRNIQTKWETDRETMRVKAKERMMQKKREGEKGRERKKERDIEKKRAKKKKRKKEREGERGGGKWERRIARHIREPAGLGERYKSLNINNVKGYIRHTDIRRM